MQHLSEKETNPSIRPANEWLTLISKSIESWQTSKIFQSTVLGIIFLMGIITGFALTQIRQAPKNKVSQAKVIEPTLSLALPIFMIKNLKVAVPLHGKSVLLGQYQGEWAQQDERRDDPSSVCKINGTSYQFYVNDSTAHLRGSLSQFDHIVNHLSKAQLENIVIIDPKNQNQFQLCDQPVRITYGNY